MQFDVYDFDHTLYAGDTIWDFWRFEVWRHPALLRYLPRQLYSWLMYLLRRWDFDRAKGGWQCYFAGIDLDAEAYAFWSSPHVRKRLYPFVQSRPADLPRIIASASARRVLLPLAEELMADAIIATEVDDAGRLTAPNCRHRAKIIAINRRFPGFTVRAMYTDDVKSDGPLLEMAQERYLIRKGNLTRIG